MTLAEQEQIAVDQAIEDLKGRRFLELRAHSDIFERRLRTIKERVPDVMHVCYRDEKGPIQVIYLPDYAVQLAVTLQLHKERQAMVYQSIAGALEQVRTQ